MRSAPWQALVAVLTLHKRPRLGYCLRSLISLDNFAFPHRKTGRLLCICSDDPLAGPYLLFRLKSACYTSMTGSKAL